MSTGTQVVTHSQLEAELRKLGRATSVGWLGSMVRNFIELDDCPATYAGAAGGLPSVNGAETDLVFNPYVEVDETAPILALRNMTDAAVDPVREWTVGATPVVMFTNGIDVSDAYKLKWCNTATLVDTCVGGGTWGDNLIIADYANNRIKNHIASTLVYYSEAASASPQYTCSDGTNYYVTYSATHLVKKYLIATDALIWTIGDVSGSGDDQFNNPQGICTDGTYLYIADKGNFRIKKHLCLTGAYVNKVGSPGTGLGQFVTPSGICTDDVHLYITEGAPGAAPLLKKHLCSTLVGVAQISADGHIDSTNCLSICTDGNFLWLLNINNAVTAAIFKYTLGLVYVSEYGGNGSGNTEFDAPFGICTDATYLYVVDTGNARLKKHLVSDYSFDSKVGSFGTGDDQFSSPRGICIAYISVVEERTGQLLVLHLDGKFYDIYPKLSLYNHLVFREDSVAAANAVEITAPVAVTPYTLTLPGTDSTGTQALVSDGAGTLSWANLGGSLNLGDLLDVSFPSGEPDIGDVLTYESGGWTSMPPGAGGAAYLDDLLDVYFPSGEPDIGDVLTYESGGWTSMPGGGSLALDDLTNVNAAAPNDNDVLSWDDGSGAWIPVIPAVGGGADILEVQVFGG